MDFQVVDEGRPIDGLGYIYLVKGPKDYIGQSVNPSHRWSGHKSWARRSPESRGPLSRAIHEHGEDAFTMSILWQGPIDELNDMEVHFISLYETLIPEGYNVQPGGKVSHAKLDLLKYIQKYGDGFVVKKPEHRVRYFVSKTIDVQTKYAKAKDYLENIEEYAKAEHTCVRKLRDGYRVRVEGYKDKHFVAAQRSDDEKHTQAIDYLHDLLDGRLKARQFPQIKGVCKHRGGYRVQISGHPWKSFDSKKVTEKENYDLAVEYRKKLLAGEIVPEPPKAREFPQVQGVSTHRGGFRVKVPGHPVKCFESVKFTKQQNYDMAVEYRSGLT